MTDPDIVGDSASQRPGWVLAEIVSGFAVLNTCLFLLSAPDWLVAILIGAWVFEPMLLAIWAALGPGWLFLKLPLSVPALLLVMAAPGIQAAGFRDVERYEFVVTVIVGMAIFAATTILLLIFRSIVGWRIDGKCDMLKPGAGRPQFNTKYLITLITLCAIALGIIGNLTFSAPEPSAFFGPEFVVNIIIVGGATIAAALLPVISIPLLVLRSQLTKRTGGWSLAFWAMITGAITLTFMALGEGDTFPFLLLVQLGAAIAGTLVGLALRLAGFRMVYP